MKMCGKGEMWSLHYHHGNLLRDQVTLHVPVFFYYYLRILQAGWKKLLLGVVSRNGIVPGPIHQSNSLL